MSSSISNTLPPPRVVITTHAADGTSTFQSDAHLTPFQPFGPAASAFTIFHSSATVPASNVSELPNLPNTLPRCPPSGVLFCVSDYPPKYSVPMHRTLSLDYAVVLSGEIVVHLDGGEEKTVKAGEFIVQRGVNHEWINRSEEWCRVMFVMVASEKIVLQDGKELEETVFKK